MKVAQPRNFVHPAIRQGVRDALDRDYDGSVKVRHRHRDFARRCRPAHHQQISQTFAERPQGGLLLRLPARPSAGNLKFDDAEIRIAGQAGHRDGGKSLDWPCKVECCGGGLSLTRTDVVVELTGGILEMAPRRGADCNRPSVARCAR